MSLLTSLWKKEKRGGSKDERKSSDKSEEFSRTRKHQKVNCQIF